MSLTDGTFWAELIAPGTTAGHISYVLLVLSMMMRTMLWLRVVAIAAGTASFLYGFFWLDDPVTVVWEAIFVATNLVQLAIMAYEQRHRALNEDEKVLVDTIMPSANMAQIRKLLALGSAKEAVPETVLFQQGEKPKELVILTRGTVQVERDGQVIGACGEGDFLGEISFQNGGPATADVVVTNQAHYTAFEVESLRSFLKRNADIAGTLQASLSRNVAAKLDRTSHAASGGATGGATPSTSPPA